MEAESKRSGVWGKGYGEEAVARWRCEVSPPYVHTRSFSIIATSCIVPFLGFFDDDLKEKEEAGISR